MIINGGLMGFYEILMGFQWGFIMIHIIYIYIYMCVCVCMYV